MYEFERDFKVNLTDGLSVVLSTISLVLQACSSHINSALVSQDLPLAEPTPVSKDAAVLLPDALESPTSVSAFRLHTAARFASLIIHVRNLSDKKELRLLQATRQSLVRLEATSTRSVTGGHFARRPQQSCTPVCLSQVCDRIRNPILRQAVKVSFPYSHCYV